MPRKTTDEAGGLPIAIVTASNALRNKFKIIWQQLNSKSNEIATNAITPIEAELCSVMCAMFPEGSKIPIEDLVIYGMGLNLFKDVHNIIEARAKVNHHIKNLPFVNIEVDEFDHQYVKMQDTAFDLAMLTAKRSALVLNHGIMLETWPNIKKYTSFYGLLFQKISGYLVHSEYPKFALFHFQYGEDSEGLSVDFFNGLEVLVLYLEVPSLPQSLNVLRDLRTLRLKVVQSKDMSVIGGLLALGYLSISTSTLTEIPKEIGNLVNLRLLDLRKVITAYIPPGVFSRMLKLEELYMPLSFRRWGCSAKEDRDNYDEWKLREKDEYDDDERTNVSLREIVHLPLNALQICMPKASLLPKKSLIFRNIQQFKILVPHYTKYQPFGEVSLHTLQLRGDACDINETRICDLMSRTEDLSLTRVRNLKNINYFMCRVEDNDFSQLKKMIISECDELEYLFDGQENWIPCGSFWELRNLHLSMLCNLKEMLHGTSRWPYFRCFKNLRQLSIRFCHKLKYVFPFVKEMRQIRSIEILDCNKMKGILYSNEIDDIDNNYGVNFIEQLYLHSLPKLIGFLVHKADTNGGVDDITTQSVTTKRVNNFY